MLGHVSIKWFKSLRFFTSILEKTETCIQSIYTTGLFVRGIRVLFLLALILETYNVSQNYWSDSKTPPLR